MTEPELENGLVTTVTWLQKLYEIVDAYPTVVALSDIGYDNDMVPWYSTTPRKYRRLSPMQF